MQLIPDVMQEASMSENNIMTMESSNVDKDIIEASIVNDVEPSPKDGVNSCSAKNVMVVIDDSCLNHEISPESKNTSVLKKELLEIINSTENLKNISKNTSRLQESQNTTNMKIEGNEDEKTTKTVLKNQLNNPKLLNGVVKYEPVEDTNISDAVINITGVYDKFQDVIKKNVETNIELANGTIQTKQVNVEVNPPAACDILPLPILINTVIPESPESMVEARNDSENISKEIVNNEIPNRTMAENHSTGIEEINSTEIPTDINLNGQKREDSIAQKSLGTDGVIKSVGLIIEKTSKESKNSSVVEKPMSTTLNDNVDCPVALGEKSDVIDTLNLDSDDEMEGKENEKGKTPPSCTVEPKECVSVNLDDDDDDDIMLVDDDPKVAVPIATDEPENIVKANQDVTNVSQNDESITDNKEVIVQSKEKVNLNEDDDIVLVNDDKTVSDTNSTKECTVNAKNDSKPVSNMTLITEPPITAVDKDQQKASDLSHSPKPDKAVDWKKDEGDLEIPTLPLEFKISFKNNIGELSRDDLEEFCLVKIVEAIVARSNLSDVRLKLKMLQKNIEEWRKKVNDLTKQNKDLDTVVKAVSDLQKKYNEERPVPIKITRSVGLQVGFTCHPSLKPAETPAKSFSLVTAKKTKQPKTVSKTPTPTFSTTPAFTKSSPNQTPQKKTTPVPFPRLVLATKTPVKANEKNSSPTNSSPVTPAPAANTQILKTALNNPSPDNRKPSAEKRPAVQSIDLTDDEPPAKQPDLRTFQSKVGNGPGRPPNRTSTVPKLLQPANRVGFIGNTTLLPANRPMYIPINTSSQQQNLGPNTTIIGPRKISPAINRQHTIVRLAGNNPPIRLGHSLPMMAPPANMRHPAPLPQTPVPKQLSHASWKWVPPRPNLKISKADNGIVISWEMDGYLDARHEEVASYQIYAYQETSTPPNTDLWKKIGDVKSLPLPMACTLTKFMAGFKYYFAVRAVDVRSRVGPFSAPGQILLLNDK